MGARLKERVTTGNCPWWFTVMGAFICSTCENVERGTWPPFGNAELDEMARPPKAVLEGIVFALAAEFVAERLVLAAVTELDGPNNWLPPVPPATRPAPPLDAPVPVRM